MTALPLSAVGGLGWETSIALSANHFLALVLSGKSSQRWFNLNGSLSTTSKSQHQVECGLLLDVVI